MKIISISNHQSDFNYKAKFRVKPPKKTSKIAVNDCIKIAPFSVAGLLSTLGFSQIVNANNFMDIGIYGKQMIKETASSGAMTVAIAPSYGLASAAILEDLEINIKSNKDLPS